MTYMIRNPVTGRQVKSDGDVGKKIIKEFDAFMKKAVKKVQTKGSPTRQTEKSVLKMINDFKDTKLENSELLKKSQSVILATIPYLNKINVPESILIEFGLMDGSSLEDTNDPLESYSIIIEGFEHYVLRPPSPESP